MNPGLRSIARTSAILILFAPAALADTVYVRDTLYVPLRGGQSAEHRILHRGLKSGTPLDRLETNEDSGYTRVRTEGGLEGWMQSQYLVEKPIASTVLEDINGQLETLEAEHQKTLLRLRDASEINEALIDQTTSLSTANETLQDELTEITDLAANAIAINDENARLNEERVSLEVQIDALVEKNDALYDNQAQAWFLRGAGTILVGLLFGFWLARRIYNRRNTSGWS